MRRVTAAGLAATAESGLLFLPLMQLSFESARASGGLLGTYLVFAPLFVVGVVVWSMAPPVRAIAWVAAAAVGAALGLAQAVVWGDGNPAGSAFLAVLAALVVLRMGALAGRDWREPSRGALLWGSVVALVEIGLAGSANPTWRSILPFAVGQFFVGTLASRAATVTLHGQRQRQGRADAKAAIPSVLVLAVLAAILVVAFAMGAREGPLHLAGGFLFRLLQRLITWLGGLFARVVALPLPHLRSAPAGGGQAVAHPSRHLGGPDWLERLMGLAAIATLFWVIVWLGRHRRPRRVPARPAPDVFEPSPAEVTEFAEPRKPRRARPRRELPAEIVRRWYAEALLLLERRGLAKPPGRTPGEYVADVTRAFPESHREFEALTRTYEDVRYGNVAVDAVTLRSIDGKRGSMMEVFRRAARADQPVDESPGEEGGT